MKKPSLNVEVYLTPGQIDELQLKDKTVIVIDVLRSCTTIAMALKNGAKEIIPVKNIEAAMKISGGLDAAVTLRGGERQAKMIEGFNLGNSPLEYTETAVKSKTIILFTTNGSPVMANGRYAKHVFLASFVNLSSVVQVLKELGEDFTIICSGSEGKFSIEDAVCAGKLINSMRAVKEVELTLDDASTAVTALDKAYGKSIPKMLQSSAHGRYLTGVGFGEDVILCGKIDSIPVVPSLAGGVFRAYKIPPAHVAKTTLAKGQAVKG
jgi:2-phosphosulfolactate phosphatase